MNENQPNETEHQNSKSTEVVSIERYNDLVKKVEDNRALIEDIRFTEINKRIAGIREFSTHAITILGILISVLGLLLVGSGYLFKSNNDDFKKEILEKIGQSQPAPHIDILDSKGNPIDGTKVPVYYMMVPSDSTRGIAFDIILRNTGRSWVNEFVTKVYCNDPILSADPSTDEKGYKYEFTIYPKHIENNKMPVNFSSKEFIVSSVGDYTLDKEIRILVKIYYGSEVSSAEFTLVPK